VIHRRERHRATIRRDASCKIPRLPISVPRSGTALSSPYGSTRFWRVIASTR